MLNITLNQQDYENIKAGLDASLEAQHLAFSIIRDVEDDAPVSRMLGDAIAYEKATEQTLKLSYGRKGIKTTIKCVLLMAVNSPQLNGIRDLVEIRVGLNHLKNMNMLRKL